MEFLINVGRFLMVGWVVYALLLIFAPRFIHQTPNQTSGIVQFVVAFVIGHLLDRALGFLRRRRAMRVANAPSDEEHTSSVG
ncbi:MAG TPA: hypothetical protein VK832_07530 [Burkholderiaceae bacterium]|jgi:hypothetical protein|nr:hypothetical protein [Burkholderiaceae bacterium]